MRGWLFWGESDVHALYAKDGGAFASFQIPPTA